MKTDKQTQLKTSQVALTLASFVIIIAGMKAAAAIIVPFLLAAFISIIASPPFYWLQKKKIPKVIALLIVIFMFLFFVSIIALLIGTSINDFTTKIPFYEARLKNETNAVISWLYESGITEHQVELNEIFNPAAILKMVGNALNEISAIFTNGFLILLTVVFMLLEVSSLPFKLKKVFKDPDNSISKVQSIFSNINKYIAIKTWISIVTGLLAALLCFIVGIDYPILWGVLAFVLNYIPTIGSLIAAVPPILLTIVQLGPIEALIILAGYILINTIMGNLVEPKVMGHGLGLSTLVVFLSLIFWGWVLGPIGMLLSVPLTIAIEIIFNSSEETKWIAVMLGSEKNE
jgi:AI-2 transport protein TqsA